jgi:hypothetical protein
MNKCMSRVFMLFKLHYIYIYIYICILVDIEMFYGVMSPGLLVDLGMLQKWYQNIKEKLC